jgi:tetratricopeptide (TPR) repeat protein
MRTSKAIGAKNYDIAIDEYKKRLETDGTDQEALSMIALCYGWKGDLEHAIPYANKRLAHDPTDFHMLLLSAKYWSNNGNEDQTYNYVCRVLENVPRSEPEDMHKSFYWLLKFLSIFKRFQGLQSVAKESQVGYEKYYKDNIEWARQYKEWYEAKHGQREEKLFD